MAEAVRLIVPIPFLILVLVRHSLR
jgi:hypothetical protein